jgi:hypothetical protein
MCQKNLNLHFEHKKFYVPDKYPRGTTPVEDGSVIFRGDVNLRVV